MFALATPIRAFCDAAVSPAALTSGRRRKRSCGIPAATSPLATEYGSALSKGDLPRQCHTELNSETVIRLVQCILQLRNLGFGLAQQSFGLAHIKLISLAGFGLRLRQLVTLPLCLRVLFCQANSFFQSANVDIAGRYIRN